MSFSGGPAGVDTEHLWHLIGGVLVGERNRPDWLFSSANQCTRIETTEASETAFHCCVYEFTHLVYFLLIANVVCLDKSTLLPPGGMERYFLLAQLSRLKSLRCVQVQFFFACLSLGVFVRENASEMFCGLRNFTQLSFDE